MSVSQLNLEQGEMGDYRDELDNDIDLQLRFQKRWRVISMTGYVITTVGTLLCSAGATYLAARSVANVAAVLSAVATVLVGTEKSLFLGKMEIPSN